MFNNPAAVAADSSGNLFVWDNGNHRIRKITPDGTVSTFAGGGVNATGYGTNVSLPYDSTSMTIDHSNVIWMATSPYLFRIGSDGYVSFTAPSGIGYFSGICVDSTNNVYYADYSNRKIYRYKTNGVLEVFAGSGNYGSLDGNGIFTSFANPRALASDAADNIYVWDSGSHMIRRINQSRDVVTIGGNNSSDFDGVGSTASFNSIYSMCVDGYGSLILACGNSIRKMTATTNATTIAGSFSQNSYTNGTGNLARFSSATSVCLSAGAIFAADSGNQRIRQISFNPAEQIVSGANLGIGTFAGVTITGTVGRTYRVESSLDMTNWATQATLLLNSSPYLWIDQNPINGNKFYRAALLP